MEDIMMQNMVFLVIHRKNKTPSFEVTKHVFFTCFLFERYENDKCKKQISTIKLSLQWVYTTVTCYDNM